VTAEASSDEFPSKRLLGLNFDMILLFYP